MKKFRELSEQLKKDKDDPCWKGYVQLGTKKKNGKEVPNCVPKEEKESVEEKSVSQAQQKMMGMALAYKRGEMPDASPEVKKMANSMSMKDLEDFAKTKHKGLPKKVEEKAGAYSRYTASELKKRRDEREKRNAGTTQAQRIKNKMYGGMMGGLKKEEAELDEAFTPKEIKMAIGVASDKRYAGGNMTGAVNAIEKIKKGLSDHPQVRAVLRRQNESVMKSFFELRESLQEAKIEVGDRVRVKDDAKKVVDRGLLGKSGVVVPNPMGGRSIRVKFVDGRSAMFNKNDLEVNESVELDESALDKQWQSGKSSIKSGSVELIRGKSGVHTIKKGGKTIGDFSLDYDDWVVNIKGKKGQHTLGSIDDIVKMASSMKESNWKPSASNVVPDKAPKYSEGDRIIVRSGANRNYVGKKGTVVSKSKYNKSNYVVKLDGGSSTIEIDGRVLVPESTKSPLGEATDFRKGDTVHQVGSKLKGTVMHKGNRDEVVVKFGSLTKSIPSSQLRLSEARKDAAQDTYFNTYSAAVQHAKAQAEKQGYEVEEDDWFNQVTTGKGKPGRGKTTRHTLKLMKNGKPTRKGLAIQVYNRDTDKNTYELNYYVS